MIVDSHAHVWSGDQLTFPFSPHDQVPLPSTPRPVEDLLTRLDAAGVSHAVLIQPRIYGYDHAYLTSALRTYASRVAAVGLVNPVRPDAPDELRRRVNEEGYAGLRLVGVDNGAAEWLFDERSAHLWRAAAELGVVVSLLVEPHHLASVPRVAATYSSTPIVIDHCGRCGPGAPEEPQLLALADFPNVSVKVSALPALSRQGAPFRDLQPLISRCYTAFGADRLLWGTDYPHVLDAGPYPTPVDVLQPLLSSATETELHRIVGGNAARLYRLKP